jgi:two-component system CAI-1 autoinducer sensor kinase/phosphatase CqsS
LTIEVDAASRHGRILFRDRGIGISAEAQPRVFEPFFSTNRGTGHGLGLAFCQRVIDSAKGTIRVKSEPGHGATFTLELPILK